MALRRNERRARKSDDSSEIHTPNRSDSRPLGERSAVGTRGGDRVFLERVPGTKGQPHTTIEGGGHFLQEGRGEQFAKVVVDFLKSSPVGT